MKKRMRTKKIIGIILLLVGVAVLAVGTYNYISYSGKFMNKAAGLFNKQTETVRNSIIEIGIGAACVIAGFSLYKKR